MKWDVCIKTLGDSQTPIYVEGGQYPVEEKKTVPTTLKFCSYSVTKKMLTKKLHDF